jgi:ABC-type Zn2+ transport system substrate-binding protein/surface adhesin
MDTKTLYKRLCRADSIINKKAVIEWNCENSSRRVINQSQELINKLATVEEKTFVVQKETERP